MNHLVDVISTTFHPGLSLSYFLLNCRKLYFLIFHWVAKLTTTLTLSFTNTCAVIRRLWICGFTNTVRVNSQSCQLFWHPHLYFRFTTLVFRHSKSFKCRIVAFLFKLGGKKGHSYCYGVAKALTYGLPSEEKWEKYICRRWTVVK